MTTDTLAAALEREHQEIDAGIEAFLAAQAEGGAETGALTRAIEALRRHIFLEEEFLFPRLREAGLVAPVFVMLREHGEIWDTIDMLQGQLRTAPGGSQHVETCNSLLARLERHNTKEEAILYPQVDATVSGAEGVGLRAFLQSGRLPDGWVCAQARSGR